MLQEKQKEYWERFGHSFPILLCMSMEDEKIVEIIQECLDDGKPYEPDIAPIIDV